MSSQASKTLPDNFLGDLHQLACHAMQEKKFADEAFNFYSFTWQVVNILALSLSEIIMINQGDLEA
jgi:hypothetical protein